MWRPEDFPLVEGVYRMTEDWSVVLPQPFRRRIEEGSLVLWRPGITSWINVWGNDAGASPTERLSWIQANRAAGGFNEIRADDDGILRYAYRLREDESDERVAAFYCYAVGMGGYVQMAVYFDTETDLPLAEALWRSLQEHLREA